MEIEVFIHQLISVAIFMVAAGVVGFAVGRIIPKRTLDHTKFPYRPFVFEEDGRIFEKLKISQWQKRVPDMSRIMAKIMPRKAIDGYPDIETLIKLIRETCMAELIHDILALLGFLIPVICPNIFGWIIMIVYILFGNLPYTVIQRYNRPRLVKLYETQRRLKQKKPTNVLILSANTGGGHNSVARTLKAYFEEQGLSVDIIDALSLKSEEYSRFIGGVHNFFYHHLPGVYSLGWTFVEHSRTVQFGKYSLNRMGFRASNKELYRCIIDNGYTTVICTHVFAAIMIGDTVKKYNMLLRTGRVETDYMNSPGAEYGFVDYHFVPSYMMIPQMVGRGADRRQIVVSGIPIPQGDYSAVPKETAKEALGIPGNKTHIFIMFGTEGNGPVEAILKRLKRDMEHPVYITVVCGRNEKLFSRLTEKFGNDENVNICGFVNNVPEIMNATDIFIGKPGGISITEAAVRKLAIIIVKTIGGCEKYNRDFFVNHGAALAVSDVNYIAKECNMLISDAELRNEISSAAYELIKTDGAETVYKTLME